jgi:V/A-type H+-transporting ATPase subunit E
MKTLEHGSQKIKKICDILKNETIEPAKIESETIKEEAKSRAEEMIQQARREIEKQRQEFRASIEQERNVFQSTLNQASKLVVETLKQEITEKLFNKELHSLVEKEMKDVHLIARLVEAMIQAIKKEGLSANLSAIIPQTVSEKEVNALLGEHILNELKEHSVILGDIEGGAKIKLHDKNMTVEMSDSSLMELLARFAPSFREAIFAP